MNTDLNDYPDGMSEFDLEYVGEILEDETDEFK